MNRLERAFVARVDIASIVFLRVAFGALLFAFSFRSIVTGIAVNDYVRPVFHFHYVGFEWVRALPGQSMLWVFWALTIAALHVAIGAFYRVFAPVLFVLNTYVFLVDEAHYLNHGYLICLLSLLLAVVPAHRAFSIDALRTPSLRSGTIDAWCLWLLRAQLAIPYVYGGLAKLNSDWLRGEPIGYYLWVNRRHHFLGPLLDVAGAKYFFAWGGVFFDLFIVPLAAWRRTRPLALAMLVFFHTSNAAMFNIGVFPWLMLAATPILFEADWPRRAWLALRRLARAPMPPPQASVALRANLPPRRWLTILVCAYLVVQLVLPFRFVLYPGDINWSEEGREFTWRMMLRHKDSVVRFRVRDPGTDVDSVADPRAYLNAFQVRQMDKIPDRIHQFARFLGAAAGGRKEVRVDAWMSLNGRPLERIIDPDVDLGAEPRRLGHASWILPLTAPMPEPLDDEDAYYPRRANPLANQP